MREVASREGPDENDVIATLIVLDEDANYWILRGHRGETISSRCGRCIKRVASANAGKWDWAFLILAGIVNAMPWFGPNHCVANIQKQFDTESE